MNPNEAHLSLLCGGSSMRDIGIIIAKAGQEPVDRKILSKISGIGKGEYE